jgi:hypothetical protein
MTGLDMWGGDIEAYNIDGSFGNAFAMGRQLIGFDKEKCALIVYQGKDQYRVIVKNSKKTNPSKSSGHAQCTVVFYARSL